MPRQFRTLKAKAFTLALAFLLVLGSTRVYAGESPLKELARNVGFGPPVMPDFKEVPWLAKHVPAIHKTLEAAWFACWWDGLGVGFNAGFTSGAFLAFIVTLFLCACFWVIAKFFRNDRESRDRR